MLTPVVIVIFLIYAQNSITASCTFGILQILMTFPDFHNAKQPMALPAGFVRIDEPRHWGRVISISSTIASRTVVRRALKISPGSFVSCPSSPQEMRIAWARMRAEDCPTRTVLLQNQRSSGFLSNPKVEWIFILCPEVFHIFWGMAAMISCFSFSRTSSSQISLIGRLVLRFVMKSFHCHCCQ